MHGDGCFQYPIHLQVSKSRLRQPRLALVVLTARQYSSAKVAQAAAYLANEAITVAQFFGRGAAIGLQMHQAPISHLASANVPWDNAATVLLDQVRQ